MVSRWDEHPLEPIARLVQARTGIDLDGVPGAHAAATIEQAMRRAGHDDPARYLVELRRGQAALDALLDALSVGESYFFRDPAQLAFVARDPPGHPRASPRGAAAASGPGAPAARPARSRARSPSSSTSTACSTARSCSPRTSPPPRSTRRAGASTARGRCAAQARSGPGPISPRAPPGSSSRRASARR
ncbi:MAG: hypothetical protein M5U28_09890 [Sandaracinaceae bacterium]|nr:hypothetical protein [Sandaracinaceae bacterium]